MDEYLSDALYAFQNDFDHISYNISYSQPRIPDMVNIIGPNAFDRDSKNFKEANKEIHDLFFEENYQFFPKKPKIEEVSNDTQSYIIPDFKTDKNELKDEKIDQLEEEEQNEILQLFNEIDGFRHHDVQKKEVQYPLESMEQKDFRPFNVTHFYTFF